MADTDGIEPGPLSTETVVERRARLGADRAAPRGRSRRVALALTGGLIGLAAVLVVAGFPGPEPIHRHPAGSLQALESRINDASHAEQSACGDAAGVRDPASIDWLSGRVVVHAGAMPAVALTDEDRSMIRPPVYLPVGNGFC